MITKVKIMIKIYIISMSTRHRSAVRPLLTFGPEAQNALDQHGAREWDKETAVAHEAQLQGGAVPGCPHKECFLAVAVPWPAGVDPAGLCHPALGGATHPARDRAAAVAPAAAATSLPTWVVSRLLQGSGGAAAGRAGLAGCLHRRQPASRHARCPWFCLCRGGRAGLGQKELIVLHTIGLNSVTFRWWAVS